jgi:hypothetical protein
MRLSTGPHDTDPPPQNRTKSGWNFLLLQPGLMKDFPCSLWAEEGSLTAELANAGIGPQTYCSDLCAIGGKRRQTERYETARR